MAKMYLLLLISLYACRSNNSEKITLNPSNSKLIKPKVDLGREYEDSSFVLFFEKFSNVVSSSNYQIFRQMSLDSLSYRHTYVAAPDFMKFYYEIVFDRELIDKISQKTDIEFLDGKVSRKYFSDFIIKEIKSEKILKKTINIKKSSKISEDFIIVVLEFIKTDSGYKFWAYDKFGS